tara:strand:- start:166 stop:1116 length:951 start_codon:yes stop_codon:yes gene_type:complete
MIKIALDMMGGDNAPSSNIYGAIDFLNQTPNKVKIYMVGDEKQISKLIDLQSFKSKIEMVHTTQVVDFNDKPSKIIKTKPDSSMNKAIKLLKDKTVDAVLSSGNTGCLLSSSFFNLGTLPGIKRPALFANIPSENGNFLLCDVGANSSSKPDHLVQFSKMASIYMKYQLKVDNPRIALLNIGSEPNKGNELIKNTYDIMNQEVNNFIGNIESRYIFDGKADIVICDGFTGNIVLKLIEGMMNYNADFISKKFNLTDVQINNLKSLYDYEQYGAVPILGINGLVFKSHGSSSKTAIFNALKIIQKVHEINLINKFNF